MEFILSNPQFNVLVLNLILYEKSCRMVSVINYIQVFVPYKACVIYPVVITKTNSSIPVKKTTPEKNRIVFWLKITDHVEEIE